MTTGITDPTLAQGAVDTTAMHEHQRKIDTMRRELNGGAGKDKKAKLREACEGFEAVFIQKMWEQMRATVPENGLMHSKDEKLWQGMYDQELSKKMAGAGGIGLADMMMTQLGKNLEEAAPKALDTSVVARREPLPIAPAPLLVNQPKAAPVETPAAQSQASDIYSGAAPAVAQAPEDQPAMPAEFDELVGRLQVEMMRPVVTHTRVTTNANSVDSFDSIKTKGKRRTVSRVVIEKTIPVAPVADPGPSMSPTSVSQARTGSVDMASPRRDG